MIGSVRCFLLLIALCATAAFGGLSGAPSTAASRSGDEIVVCGQYFHTGTLVVLWTDPGGYATGNLTPPPVTQPSTRPNEPVETLRGGNISLPELQNNIDQFVIHFDACGTSRECFTVLNHRHLSVQLMCDLDGTIYQTMDLKDEAYHATIANERSVGVETANMGGQGTNSSVALFKQWYKRNGGWTTITIPERLGDGGIRTANFVGRPARSDFVVGDVQGKHLRQYDYTPQQYQALAHIAATLCTVFPKIQPDFPRLQFKFGGPTLFPATAADAGKPATQPVALADVDQPGMLIPHVLTIEQWSAYQGILGHYHVQLNKQDPGPAFQWLPFIREVKNLMSPDAKKACAAHAHQPVGLPTYRRHATTLPTTEPATEPSTEPTTSESMEPG